MLREGLRIGQAIEFDIAGDDTRLAMILEALPEGQDDGATHLVEVIPSVRDKRWREERVHLDQNFGLMTNSIVGTGQSQTTPYRFKGFHLPPLPEHQEHSCTDKRFLCVFFFALGLYAWIAQYAFKHGHIRNIHHAVDYNGSMCGVDVPGKPFGFWCLRQHDEGINLRYPICVSECPNSTETQSECWDGVNHSRVFIRDYATANFLHSPYCWPKENRLLEQMRHARENQLPSPGKLLIGMPRKAVFVIPVAAMISCLVGYFYFKLLEKCVDFVVVLFILFTTYLSLLVGGYHLFLYSRDTGDTYQLILGLGLIAVSLCAFRFFCSEEAQSSINMAAGCIEAACECINEEVSLLFEPFVAMALRMFVLSGFLTVFVLLVTCGAPHIHEGHARHSWGYTKLERLYIVYLLLLFVWLMELTTSLSQYVLAWVTERWYFTPYVDEQKIDRDRHVVIKGYMNAVRWHMGTLAMGSLLIGVLRIPRIFLKMFTIIANLVSNAGAVCGCLAATCCAPCSVFHNGIGHINKNAYIGVAHTSENFWQAATSAELMLNSNSEVQSIAWLNGMQGVFQLGGLILITTAAGFGTFVWISVTHICGPDTAVRDAMIWLACVVAFPIGLSYMTLFDTVGDTILYCWGVQQRRYNYHKDHLRKRSRIDNVRGLFSTIMPSLSAGDEEFGDDGLARVNYAPPALRELVLGRHRKLVPFEMFG